jgi:hypothetical protein
MIPRPVIAAFASLALCLPLRADPPSSANYDEAKVPPYTLPDPLRSLDGSIIADAAAWRQKRRPEVVRIFESEVYGRVPPITAKPLFEVVSVADDALDGQATRKLVTVWLLGQRGGPRLDLLIYLPRKRSGPVPTFLGLNFVGNQGVSHDPAVPLTQRWVRPASKGAPTRATEESRGVQASRWEVGTVVARGYATATAYYGDIEEDYAGGESTGVRAAVLALSGKTQFAADEWGATAAWAWGLSRAMDYLATDPDIDATRVAVHGHSRLGKTALWAGALDQRFAMVISNNSGEGGASLMRRNFGENIAIANAWEPRRFARNFRRYGHAVTELPVDAHLLIALAAPRPVYVASATEDLLADPKGEFLAAYHAGPVYRLFGKAGIPTADLPAPDQPVGDTVRYHIRTGKHDITAYDWARYLDFADKFFRK